MYQFDRTVERRGTDSVKWDGMASAFGRDDLLPFWIADMDFPVMPEIVEAMTQRAMHPSYGYTQTSDAFYSAFIDWNQRRNGYTIQKEEILLVPGVVCAQAFVVHALMSAGGQALLCSPVYDPFYRVMEQHGMGWTASSLVERNGRWEMDWEDLESKLPHADLFILCNPHNPVGRAWSREELTRLTELCARFEVPIFSDDIHSDLVFPGHSYIPLPTLSPQAKEGVILATAPSKTFNIPGLECSILVIHHPALRQKVAEKIQAFHIGVNLMGLTAATAAYQKGDAWVDALNQTLYENAAFVESFCKQHLPKVRAFIPEATYLLWLDFSGYGMSQKELEERLIQKARVALNSGPRYGPEGKGYMRLNIGTSKDMLEEGLKRILAALS